MAKTERAREFMRLFRIVTMDTHCDDENCHGTHIDRITWEIARRQSEELGTEEVMAELDPEDYRAIMWIAYVKFTQKQWGTPAQPPPFSRNMKVIIPKEVAEAGITQEGLDELCSRCNEDDCRICSRSNSLQGYVLRERTAIKCMNLLNNKANMEAYFSEVYGWEVSDDPAMCDD